MILPFSFGLGFRFVCEDKLQLHMQNKAPKKRHRCAFTQEEDALLRRLVQMYGTDNWALVSRGMIGRTARQCRERYRSYLMPTLKNGPWTAEEDILLLRLVQMYHNKWVLIASHFDGRSDSNVKNRWYTHFQATMPSQMPTDTGNMETDSLTTVDDDADAFIDCSV